MTIAGKRVLRYVSQKRSLAVVSACIEKIGMFKTTDSNYKLLFFHDVCSVLQELLYIDRSAATTWRPHVHLLSSGTKTLIK